MKRSQILFALMLVILAVLPLSSVNADAESNMPQVLFHAIVDGHEEITIYNPDSGNVSYVVDGAVKAEWTIQADSSFATSFKVAEYCYIDGNLIACDLAYNGVRTAQLSLPLGRWTNISVTMNYNLLRVSSQQGFTWLVDADSGTYVWEIYNTGEETSKVTYMPYSDSPLATTIDCNQRLIVALTDTLLSCGKQGQNQAGFVNKEDGSLKVYYLEVGPDMSAILGQQIDQIMVYLTNGTVITYNGQTGEAIELAPIQEPPSVIAQYSGKPGQHQLTFEPGTGRLVLVFDRIIYWCDPSVFMPADYQAGDFSSCQSAAQTVSTADLQISSVHYGLFFESSENLRLETFNENRSRGAVFNWEKGDIVIAMNNYMVIQSPEGYSLLWVKNPQAEISL